MIKREKTSYQMKNTNIETEKRSEEDEKIEFRVFGRRRDTFLSRKIGEKWDRNHVDPIYRRSQFLDGSRGIEN